MQAVLRQGTFLWLVAHEMRLSWRALDGSAKWRTFSLVLLCSYVLLGFGVAYWLLDTPLDASPNFYIMTLIGAFGILTFNLGSALNATQRTLFESGDLELLLSAPIAPRRVMMAKLVSICATMLRYNVFFFFPIIIPVALVGHPGLLGLPAVVIAISIYATCLGLALTLLIVRLSGPRAARKLIQIFAAVITGAAFLASQLAPQVGDGNKKGYERLFDWCRMHGVGVEGITSLPGKAAFGNAFALAVLLGSGLALFVLTAWSLQTLFLRSYQTAENKTSGEKTTLKNLKRHFSNHFSFVIIRKETRLLLRDPELIFGMLLQLLYMAPLMILMAKATNLSHVLPGAAFLSVFGAGQLVGNITGLTIYGEDVPDLLIVSPRPAKEITRLKLLAALLMGTPLTLIIPVLMLTTSPIAATITLALTLLGASVAAAIEFKLSKPATRRKFIARRSGSFLSNILIFAATGMLGGICAYGVFLLG